MPTIREALEQAASGETPEVEAAPIEAPSSAPAAPEDEAQPAAPETEAAPDVPEDAQAARARDGKGRFTSSQQQAAAAATAPTKPPPGATPPAAAQPPPTAETKFKAPQAWRPAAREKFASLPPEIQEEIDRREREVPRALQESADARRFHETVRAGLQPYEGLARAFGSPDALTYAGNLLQTVSQLAMGAPQQRAQIVAGIIRQFGVDVPALAAALDGQPAPAGAPSQPAMTPEAIRQIAAQEWEQRQSAAAEQHYAAHVAQLERDPKFEFFNDPIDDSGYKIREVMADLVQQAARAGRNMTDEAAYSRALMMSERHAPILEQRKAAEAARTASASTARRAAAAISVRSTPAAAPAAQPKGIREALEAAAQKHGMPVE